MRAYIDESGSTGTNMFDTEQPIFFTGFVASSSDLDVILAQEVAGLTERLNVLYLHAKDIPNNKRAEYFEGLAALVEKYDLHFGICQIEKRYIVACKLVDVLFDAVENFGVPLQWYFAKELRLSLVFNLAAVVSQETYRSFWNCLMEPNGDRRSASFQETLDRLEAESKELQDPRIREVVASAITWARGHPETITLHLSRKRSFGHAPNLAAFLPMLTMLGKLHSSIANGVPLHIVHDRSNQFAQILEDAHRKFSTGDFKDVPALPVARDELHVVEGSTFEIRESSASAGLQIIDGFLWAHAKTVLSDEMPDVAIPLLRKVSGRVWIDELSFDNVGAWLSDRLYQIMQLPFDDEALEAGKQFRDKNERARLGAITRLLEGKESE